MRSALLMPGKNMPDLVLVMIHGIVDGHDSAARISEDHIHTLLNKGKYDGFCTIQPLFD